MNIVGKLLSSTTISGNTGYVIFEDCGKEVKKSILDIIHQEIILKGNKSQIRKFQGNRKSS